MSGAGMSDTGMSDTGVSGAGMAGGGTSRIDAVVFDVGRVIVQWELRALFAKLIDDPAELDRFLAEVVTEQWHFQCDAGRPLAEMVRERQAQFPQHAAPVSYTHLTLPTKA